MLRYVDIVIECILEGDYFEKYEFNDILIYDKKNTELREFIFHPMADRYYDFVCGNVVRKIWVIFDTIRNPHSKDIFNYWDIRKVYHDYPNHKMSSGTDATLHIFHLMRYFRIYDNI